MDKNRIYVIYRKTIANLSSILFKLCRIFPINDNLVAVCAFEGKRGFCCNPKYLVEEIHRRNPEYKFVWFVNNMDFIFPEYIKKVPNTIWHRAYWLSKSKVWIDNYRKPLGTIKRKGQLYINTWHGTLGFKPIGLMRGNKFSEMAYLVSKNDSEMIDYVSIDSDFAETIFPEGMVYSGEFIKFGNPRYDGMQKNISEKRIELRKRHNLNEKVKIALYAPTFRENYGSEKRQIYGSEISLDIERILKGLENRFGGEWCICIRVHPQLVASHQTKENLNTKIIDESNTDDMYDILAGFDAFITDFSGAAFEAAMLNIPVFLYAEDVNEYIEKRGELIWDFARCERHNICNNKRFLPQMKLVLPFPIANNNEELVDDIMTFQREDYLKRTKHFFDNIGLIYDGMACKNIVDMLEKIMERK